VVEGLAVLLQDADAPAGLVGGLEDDLLEQRLVDEVRAGKGQDQARRPDALEGQPRQPATTSVLFLAKAGGSRMMKS
jgi:hypothetical protein